MSKEPIENKDGDWHGMYGEPEEAKLYTEPPISTQENVKSVQSYVNKAGECRANALSNSLPGARQEPVTDTPNPTP